MGCASLRRDFSAAIEGATAGSLVDACGGGAASLVASQPTASPSPVREDVVMKARREKNGRRCIVAATLAQEVPRVAAGGSHRRHATE
jgi:hypothetical protein